MKNTLLTLFILLLAEQTTAQNIVCGFDKLYRHHVDSTPTGRWDEKQFNDGLQQFRQSYTYPSYGGGVQRRGSGCLGRKFLIPVIVHIIHATSDSVIGSGSNISNQQVLDQMVILNDAMGKAFSGGHTAAGEPDMYFCIPEFGGKRAIYRYASKYTNINANGMNILDSIKGNFPNDKNYIHIYIVNSIVGSNNGVIAGIGIHPSIENTWRPGIMLARKFCGDATANNNYTLDARSRGLALVHEMGHFLGLFHTFDGGCAGMHASDCATGGDLCCDTPPVNGANTTCTPGNSCHETPDKNDLIQNHMDYTPDDCRILFTPDQISIMQFTLLNYRSALVNPEFLSTIKLPCTVNSPWFMSDVMEICDSGEVTFTGIWRTGVPSPYFNWQIFKNSTLIKSQSSSSNIFKVKLTSTGLYTVQVKIMPNACDTITLRRSNMVEVKKCGPILQDPNAVWNFGERLSVEFHENGMISTLNARKVIPPPGIKTAQTAISVSDTNGVLRFYGGNDDGNGRSIVPPGLNKRVKLWYRDTASDFDFITPRSSNEYIKGTGNAFQNLVVNRPGFPKEYWWVTLYNGSGNGHLYYRKIALNNTNHYDISGPANIALKGPAGFPADSGAVFSGEAISAVASANDSFYWMFFLCPSKTGTAFDSTLVIYKILSDTITYFNSIQINEPGYGVIKVSPDGRWVYANSNLYEFNRKTGAISLKHCFYDYAYKRRNATTAAEFSPNSRFLYVALSNNSNTMPSVDSIFQLDLDQKDPYVKRKTIAITSKSFLLLFQRTPDSRIAMIRSNYVNILDFINEPDSLCSTVNPNNCKFTLNAFNPTIPGRTDMNVNISLPDPVIDLRDKTEMRISYYADSCFNYRFTHNIPWATGSIWYFGDGNQSTGREVNHIYSAGNYEVLCIIGIDTLRISISVKQKTFSISGKTATCDSNQFAFYHVNTGKSDLKYDWNVSGGTNTYPSSLNQAYIKWYGSGFVNVVLFDQFDGCAYKDTLFTVPQNSISNNTISGDTLFCSNMISIAGSNPIGGSGSFTYSWLLARNGVEYSLDSFSRSLTYLATKMPYSIGKLYRNVVSNGCTNRSNGLTVIIRNQSNKLVVIPDGCSDIITDADTLNRIPGSTYQWQMSADSFNWTNINGANKAAIAVTNKSWPKRFFRRLEYVASCGYDTSNIQIITGLIYIIEQPVDAAACKNMEFTMNVILNDNRAVASSFRWQYLDFVNWIDLPIDPGGSPGLTDIANKYSHGTTFRLKISNPCFILYSNTAVLKKVANPSFTYLTGDGNLFVKGDTIIPDTSSSSSYRMTAAWHGERNVAWTTWYRSTRPEGARWDSIGATTSNYFTDAAPFNLCQKRYFYKVTLRNLCKASYEPTYWTKGDPSKTRYFSVGDESVISPPSAPDLWIRDSYRDWGNEPNWIDSQHYTASFYLWNRVDKANKDRIEDWIQRESVKWDEDTNWIHIVIKNRGNAPATDGKIFLYWTVMSVNEDWPYSWTGLAKYKNLDPNNILSFNHTYPLGNRINKTGIDLATALNQPPIFNGHAAYNGQLLPGDSIWISYPWTHADTVPMPAWYYGTIGNPPKFRYAADIGLCLLARLTTCDSQAQGMTFPEKLNMGTDKPVKHYGNIGYNIVRNNNIASANFYLGYMYPPFSDTVQVWSLGAPPPADSSGGNSDVFYTFCGDNPIYFNNGEVQVTLSNEVWQPFAAAGKPGNGFYSNKDNEIVITDPCATIGPFSISDTVLPFWGFNFRYKPGTYQNGVPISTVFHLKQFKTTGDLVGMCSYGVHSTGMGPGGEGQGEGKPADMSPTQFTGKVNIYPNPIDNQLLLEVVSRGNERFDASVYDAAGRLVARLGQQKITTTGKSVYSIHTAQLPPGVYTVSMRLNEAQFTRKIIKID